VTDPHAAIINIVYAIGRRNLPGVWFGVNVTVLGKGYRNRSMEIDTGAPS